MPTPDPLYMHRNLLHPFLIYAPSSPPHRPERVRLHGLHEVLGTRQVIVGAHRLHLGSFSPALRAAGSPRCF